jgi:hypothetical protein
MCNSRQNLRPAIASMFGAFIMRHCFAPVRSTRVGVHGVQTPQWRIDYERVSGRVHSVQRQNGVNGVQRCWARFLARKQRYNLAWGAGFGPGGYADARRVRSAAVSISTATLLARVMSRIPVRYGITYGTAGTSTDWGNPQKGPHSSFAKFAGGTEPLDS